MARKKASKKTSKKTTTKKTRHKNIGEQSHEEFKELLNKIDQETNKIKTEKVLSEDGKTYLPKEDVEKILEETDKFFEDYENDEKKDQRVKAIQNERHESDVSDIGAGPLEDALKKLADLINKTSGHKSSKPSDPIFTAENTFDSLDDALNEAIKNKKQPTTDRHAHTAKSVWPSKSAPQLENDFYLATRTAEDRLCELEQKVGEATREYLHAKRKLLVYRAILQEAFYNFTEDHRTDGPELYDPDVEIDASI